MSAPAGLLDQTMTVYTQDATTGLYTVQAVTGVACRLAHMTRRAEPTGPSRTELDGYRNLMWDDSYVMPSDAQVQIAGPRVETDRTGSASRWNVQEGTQVIAQLPDGSPSHRRAIVVQAQP